MRKPRSIPPTAQRLAAEQRFGDDVAAIDAALDGFQSPVATTDLAEIAGLPRRRARIVARMLVDGGAAVAPIRGYLKAAA